MQCYYYRFRGNEDKILRVTGVAYFAVALLGFLTSGNQLLGLIKINEADRRLHLVLAIVILVSGYALPADSRSAASTRTT